MKTDTKISVIVPVYNSYISIQELSNRLFNTIHGNFHCDSEIIIVDDFSTDDSWIKITEIKKQYPSLIKAIKLSKNFGQHNATLCGIKHAKNNYIITIDDDLEFQPEDIVKLFHKQQEGDFDVVYGVDNQKKYNIFLNFFYKFYKRIACLVYGKNYVVGSSFRLIKYELAKKILIHSRNFSFIDEFIIWYTANLSSIAVNSSISKRGKSRYTISKLFNTLIGLVLISSTLPLKLIKVLGLLLTLVNFIIGLYIIYQRIKYEILVDGYTSIIVSILFTSGIIIFILSIIAEYISKLLKISYNQPAYNEEIVL